MSSIYRYISPAWVHTCRNYQIFNLCGYWRLAKSTSKNKSAIYEIPLSQKARMFFSSFDTDAALQVWDLATEVRQQWENQISDSDLKFLYPGNT